MRSAGIWAESAERVIEPIPDFQGVVEAQVLAKEEAQLNVHGLRRGAPNPNPEVLGQLVPQVEVYINRCVVDILHPNGWFDKTPVAEEFIHPNHGIIMLHPFSVEFAVFILEGQIQPDDLWHGDTSIKVIAIQKAAVELTVGENAQPNVGVDPVLVVGSDDVVLVAQPQVGSFDTVLHCAHREAH